MVIGEYFIVDIDGYYWLLITIVLMVIGKYSIVNIDGY
jgi:hypothetical protein